MKVSSSLHLLGIIYTGLSVCEVKAGRLGELGALLGAVGALGVSAINSLFSRWTTHFITHSV